MGKKKIIFCILLYSILFICMPSDKPCLAEQGTIQVFLDGHSLSTEMSPVLTNGRLFLPARDIIEALGGRITWFPALKLLNIKVGEREISLVMDISEAELNGKVISLETSPRIIQNRVMIPVDVIHLLMDIEINWDKNSEKLNMIRQRPFLTGIRNYTHPEKTRIVIDMSEPTPYYVSTLNNPDRIVVDVNGSVSKLDSQMQEVFIDDTLIDRVRTGQFDQNTARVVLDLKDKLEYQAFDLSSPQRIVIDILNPGGQIAEENISAEMVEETVLSGKQGNGEFVVVIDPGHGGSQPGAIGPNGLKEKDVVLDISLQLRKILQNEGFTVYLTRDKDIDVSLERRPLMALQEEASIFISVHINSALQKGSSTARGVETYVLNSRYIGASAKDVADRENKASQYHNYEDNILNQIIADLEESASIGFSLDFADIAQKKLVQHTNLENRGVKQAPFIVLKGVNMAAILIEVGFISNPNEEKLLKTTEFRGKIAQALAQSVKEYTSNLPENL